MNKKEKTILILHRSTSIDESKVLQHAGDRRIGDVLETRPVIYLDRLTPKEADTLGLIIDQRGQISVKHPEVLSGTRTIMINNHFLDSQLVIVNEVLKSSVHLFKESGFEGCRTPIPFRNDKAIYKQHKRQRKHK